MFTVALRKATVKEAFRELWCNVSRNFLKLLRLSQKVLSKNIFIPEIRKKKYFPRYKKRHKSTSEWSLPLPQ